MDIQDQIVLVTGGARGLGLAITRTLLHQGARVVVNYYTSEQSALQLSQEFPEQVFSYKADVTKLEEVNIMFQKAKQHFGHAITSVVNNALLNFQFNGDARPKVETLNWQNMQQQIESAVKATLNTTQAALEDMKKDHFGRIINIGTNLVQNPVVPYHDYTAAKAALLAFTRTTAQDLGQYGINVNMLSGGLLRKTDASCATPDFVFDLIAQSTPLKEVTTPEQFADAVLLFLSPWSRAVTGQNLIVDGGLVKG
ncbi:3-oxoacyl-ACP reductase [Acinetobacter sichuanensis]|uniref:3-oxoacyl-ACP reductase n=1 Tax=Acinetobacter sichuanensis TaxID=2136183 RepID=A0A371YTY9_9GAMM|nr:MULTISPECIES: 3-oxoacyl-ACP reductase [Acinetobacter]MDM1246962.1 3-oxoacyl-ACP reductase [Acinetobacter sp. R933-2]MDM1763428.1 3-oxoacyl-ACP reductase [Acinetobacter sp. 226-1]MDM1766907.1 3-oxoacyl-ACP reductase [Acinetobacter sp. 226-4]MDQ9019624.1 3-oxoacyl-ACP reductase [Acinetobacter sichuanensis]RFC84928.1 3-oxoacyl-ACP reductase [Acinetobacter sichuanensis]